MRVFIYVVVLGVLLTTFGKLMGYEDVFVPTLIAQIGFGRSLLQ